MRFTRTTSLSAGDGGTFTLQPADGFHQLALVLHVLHVIQQLILGVTVYLDKLGAIVSAIVADILVILNLVALQHTHFLTAKKHKPAYKVSITAERYVEETEP